MVVDAVSELPGTDELAVPLGAVDVVDGPADDVVVDDDRVVDVDRGTLVVVERAVVVLVARAVVGDGAFGTIPFDDTDGGRTSRYSVNVAAKTAPSTAVDLRTRSRVTIAGRRWSRGRRRA